ncbi:MAG: hypothetical protein PF574_05030 [Candidatus Delongbacteria bacterium]|jgi:hypothetical protein|nr:hypothetical protein [Candidatus Delongbacteria bacterium]
MKYITTILLAILMVGCSKTVIVSKSLGKDMSFNKFIDSAQRSSVILEDENIMTSVMNDDEFVYIFLSQTETMKDEKLKNNGHLVTFNSGEKNTFGIKYPMSDIEFVNRDKDNVSIREAVPQKEDIVQEIGIYFKSVLKKKLNKNQATKIGVEAEWKEKNSKMGCYLKIPISSSEKYPYAVDLKKDVFTVAFETNNSGSGGIKPSKGEQDGQGMSGPPQGGRPPKGERDGGGRNGQQRPDMKDQGSKTVKIIIKLESEKS